MGRKSLLWAVFIPAVFSGVAALYLLAASHSQGRDGSPLYSVARHDPWGTAALKDLLVENGRQVRILHHRVPDETSGATLLQTLYTTPGFRQSATDHRRLMEWVARGNSLVQLTRGSTRQMQELHLLAQPGDPSLNIKELEQSEAAGIKHLDPARLATAASWIRAFGAKDSISFGGELELVAPAVLQAGTTDAWQPLAVLKGPKNEWVAASRSVGRGRIIVIAAPSLVLNGALTRSRNLEFVLSMLEFGSGEVIFDEHVHGMESDLTLMHFIRSVGLLPVILQALVAVGLYVWSTAGCRLADPPREKRRRSSLEQIETLGNLYSIALAPPEIYHRVSREVHLRLAGALHCSPESIGEVLAHAPREQASRGSAILAALAELRGEAQQAKSLKRLLPRLAALLRDAAAFVEEKERGSRPQSR